MKSGFLVIIIGIIMFASGLVMFYSIEMGENDLFLRLIKNIGTFIGFVGMGITLAGILLNLISKSKRPIQENFDV